MPSETDTKPATLTHTAIGDTAEFLVRLSREVDRSIVIVAATRVEIVLERLLKRVCVHHPGGTDNLFDPERPLGTFSAKIVLAFRFGLLTNDMEHALQLLRKVRNDFAHSIEDCSIAQGSAKSRVIELIKTVQQTDSWALVASIEQKFVSSGCRPDVATFCAALCAILASLEVTSLRLSPANWQMRAGLNKNDVGGWD